MAGLTTTAPVMVFAAASIAAKLLVKSSRQSLPAHQTSVYIHNVTKLYTLFFEQYGNSYGFARSGFLFYDYGFVYSESTVLWVSFGGCLVRKQ